MIVASNMNWPESSQMPEGEDFRRGLRKESKKLLRSLFGVGVQEAGVQLRTWR